MLRHSAYVLSKLILKLSEEFEIMLSTYTVYSLQNFCGLHCNWWVLCRLLLCSTSDKQIFTQKFESPGFQIEHQIKRLMLLLVVFNQRSIKNPSAKHQIIFEKCSFRSDQHPLLVRQGAARSSSHAVCSTVIGYILNYNHPISVKYQRDCR